MSTATPPAGGQTPPADDPTTRQTPPTSGQTPTTPPESSEDDKPISLSKSRELRDENKQRRLELEATQAELKKMKDALLSEDQRKTQESEAQKEQLRLATEQNTKLLVDNAVLIYAPKVGIDAELAQALIKSTAVKIKDGEVDETSVKNALAALLERFPQLAVNPGQQGQQQQQGRPPAPRVPPTNPPASSVGTQPQYSFKNRPGWAAAIKKTS